jgi:hypothetical protein
MRRLRRRLLLALPIALAISFFGGARITDPATFTLRTRGATELPKTSLTQDLALAPAGPVASDGLSAGIAALNGAPAPRVESVIKTAPTKFSGSAPRQAAPPAALSDSSLSAQAARQNGTWAVVIGINDYPGTENDLRSAVNDADDMVQALRMLGVTNDHILVLRDGQVNAASLLKAVAWLANHAAPDAVAGFFYAGHAATKRSSPVTDPR